MPDQGINSIKENCKDFGTGNEPRDGPEQGLSGA